LPSFSYQHSPAEIPLTVPERVLGTAANALDLFKTEEGAAINEDDKKALEEEYDTHL
jgi:hypothetical protein